MRTEKAASHKKNVWRSLVFVVVCAVSAPIGILTNAQTATNNRTQNNQTTRPAPTPPPRRIDRAATTNTTQPSGVKQSGERSLSQVKTRAEFDSISRVYRDTPYALPHVLFVIDRRDKNKIYYVNSNRFKFHRDFVNGTYLSLDRGSDFERNYTEVNRRFYLGTLAYQNPVKRFTFEFWEGDTVTPEQIKEVGEIINQSFFDKVAFKPNSLKQEEATANVAGLERVLQSDIASEQEYQPFNLARGIGRIHIIKKLDDTVEIGSNEIVVLDEVPVSLPPVAGIIITKPATPLSHINLLAKSWGVPNAYIKNAHEILREFDGWWVSFETKPDAYNMRRADRSQLDEYQQRLAERRDLMRPRFNLDTKTLLSLRGQRARSVISYGAKSANLGEVMNARLSGINVPAGFTIPFYYYDEFVRDNDLEEPLYEMMNDQQFVHNPSYRRKKLEEMRARFKAAKLNDRLRAEVVRRVRAEFGNKGVFVRSSSNTEDLPDFNGAGLYDTVPNVRGDKQLDEAIKTVWASLWNFEAYEARERAGIDHTKVYMAVIVQEGINADSAGVMITTDPYNRENRDMIFISAKRGLGIKVVEGRKIPEQILYNPVTANVQVLTRSAEDSLLTFDETGGVREVAVAANERNVLTDANVRRLARAAAQVKRVFGRREQDIEWGIMGNVIYILQSRPYIEK